MKVRIMTEEGKVAKQGVGGAGTKHVGSVYNRRRPTENRVKTRCRRREMTSLLHRCDGKQAEGIVLTPILAATRAKRYCQVIARGQSGQLGTNVNWRGRVGW